MASRVPVLDALKRAVGTWWDGPNVYAGGIAAFLAEVNGAAVFACDAITSEFWFEPLAAGIDRLAEASDVVPEGVAWIETRLPNLLHDYDSDSTDERCCGVLIDTHDNREGEGFAKVRFVYLDGRSPDQPVVLPWAIGVDSFNFGTQKLSYSDRLRARMGVPTTAEASPSQLQAMAVHVVDAGPDLAVYSAVVPQGRWGVRVPDWFFGCAVSDDELRRILAAVFFIEFEPGENGYNLRPLGENTDSLFRGAAHALAVLGWLADQVASPTYRIGSA